MSEKSPFFLKKIKFTQKKYYFLHISSSYAKILGEKLFRTWEIPEVGQKQKTEKKKKKERKILQGLRVAQAAVNERWP